MHSIIIATIAITRRELQHHCHHNTTLVSTKTERKDKSNKIKEKKRIKKRNRECRKVGMHQ